MMKNKYYIIIISILLFLGLIGKFLIYSIPGDILIDIAGTIGTILLIANGNLFRKTHFKIIILLFFIAFVGAIFHLMHWPYSSYLLYIPMGLIPLIYINHFINKKTKEVLDYLKLVWVVFSFVGGILILNHIIPNSFNDVINIMLWITISYFGIQEFRDIKTQNNED